MRLNRRYRCLVLFTTLLLRLTEGWTQVGFEPLDELNRLSTWSPVHQSGLPRPQPITPANPYAYASLDDLLQSIKGGCKVEALNIDNTVLKAGRLDRLQQLTSVRALYVNTNESIPTQIDSLFQAAQNWPSLQRLTLNVNPRYPAKIDPSQRIVLSTRIYQFPKLREVQLNGSGIELNASLKVLAGLKTLRYLTLNSWSSQSTNEQPIHFAALPQLVSLKINGAGFALKSDSFAELGQLKALTLFDVKVDTTTFDQTLNQLTNLEILAIEHIRSIKRLRLSGLKRLKSLTVLSDFGLFVESSTFASLSNLERLTIDSMVDNDLSALCLLPHLRTLVISSQDKPLQIPDCVGQLNQLTELRLERMTLNRLPIAMGSLRQLKKLSLTYCHLDSLPPTITQLTMLEELNLEGNKLRQLPDINSLVMLKELNVSNNQLVTLSDDIGRLSKLTTLNLATNKLMQLPSTLARLVALRTLTVNNNQLEQLPDDLGKLRKLKTVSLQGNSLVSLPASINQLDSLQSLFIGNNRLKSLPVTLAKLKNLTALYIGKNELTTLPNNLGELTSLTALSISSNPLVELPTSIGQLRSLRSLDINGTQVRLLPDNIGELTKLESVILSNNELIALPNSISNWQNVTNLSLNNNRLEGLPNGIGRLSKLTFLQMSGKDKVTEGSVGGLQQLPDSIIHCTQLQNLLIDRQPQLDANDVFMKAARLKSLLTLRIVESNVSHLPDIDWKDVNWQSLVLNQNLLTKLPVGILEAPFLRGISVGQNRLPEVLNQDFHDKEVLQVSFVESGALPSDRLPKPSRKVAFAYQQLSTTKAREKDWDGVLADLNKAVDYAPDTTKAFAYGQRANFLFFRKQYPEALANYDKAIEYGPWIKKDKLSDSLTANRMMASFGQQKATVLGIMGQYEAALTALTQAESLLPNSDNTSLSGLVHTERGRYLTMKNRLVEADSSYRKAIRAYEKLPNAQPGNQLTVVELSLLTGQYERAQQAIASIPAKRLNSGYDVVKEYLENCLMVLKGEQDGTKAMERLTAYLSKHPAKVYGWNFDLFDNWLAKAKLSADKVTALRQLTDTTKERLVKPQ